MAKQFFCLVMAISLLGCEWNMACGQKENSDKRQRYDYAVIYFDNLGFDYFLGDRTDQLKTPVKIYKIFELDKSESEPVFEERLAKLEILVYFLNQIYFCNDQNQPAYRYCELKDDLR